MEEATTTSMGSEEMGRKHWRRKRWHRHGRGSIYFLGGFGAAIYYIQNAVGFGGVVLAILKAMVWPAFLVYEVLKFLAA